MADGGGGLCFTSALEKFIIDDDGGGAKPYDVAVVSQGCLIFSKVV